MGLQFELAGSQIDGDRDYQEDAFLITHLTDADGNPSALVVMADGMGGHAAGNVASNMAVQAANKRFTTSYPSNDPGNVLYDTVMDANMSIQKTVAETQALSGMGCTMVNAAFENGKMWWVSVGDSHLYLIRDRQLTKKNADHSYGGFLERMEAMGTPVEPEPGIARNMLMSALTGEDIADIDLSVEPFELQAGDRVIVASDGLDTLSTGMIIQYSEWSETAKECSEALLNAVEEAKKPRQDNTTVVVIDVIDPDAKPTPAVDDQDGDDSDPTLVPDDEDRTEPHASDDDITEPHDEDSAQAAGSGPASSAEPAPDSTAKQGKGNGGLIIGIIAILAIVAGGAWFMLQGGTKPAATPAGSIIEEDTGSENAGNDAAPETDTQTTATDETTGAPASPPISETPPAPPQTGKPPTPQPTAKQPSTREFRDRLKSGGLGPVMVRIPGGTFEMGSKSSIRFADERPRHTVTVQPFAMSKYEVTFAEYERFARATKRRIPDNNYLDRDVYPVVRVKWEDALYYTRWLSKQTGATYRLPSEAEWEYAAAAGSTGNYPWGYSIGKGKAHCFDCGSRFDPSKPAKVGSFKPNAFGLYDTAGNVAEWVQDCYHKNYKEAPNDGTSWEGGDCSKRIARGGSYSNPSPSLRTQRRDKYNAESAHNFIGIRLVRELD